MKGSHLRCVVALIALSLFAVTFASGCAAMRESAARQAHINQETKQHVYDMSCEQVWPTARQLLFSNGYSVKDTGEGTTMTLETEWAYQGKSSVRYLVQGIEPADSQCKVNFTKNVRSQSNTSTSRDLDIEWQLLKKVDQETAQKILQEANVKGKAAAAG